MPASKTVGRWLTKRVAEDAESAKSVVGQLSLDANECDAIVLVAVAPVVSVGRYEYVVLRGGLAAEARANGVGCGSKRQASDGWD